MPLAIAIVIILMIWVVYPAYSNGTDGVKEKYEQLKKEKARVAGMEGKTRNAASMAAQLSSYPEKDVLYKFIPEDIKEEEIIDNLNFIASSSGLGAFDFAVDQPEELSANLASESLLASQNSALGSEDILAPAVLPEAQKVSTSLRVVGSYENIEKFLGDVGKLARFNSFSKLQIGRYDVDEEKSGLSDVLAADIITDFNFLKKPVLSENSANDPVFSNSQLNTGIVSEIKDAKTGDVLKLNIDQKGKANPFNP